MAVLVLIFFLGFIVSFKNFVVLAVFFGLYMELFWGPSKNDPLIYVVSSLYLSYHEYHQYHGNRYRLILQSALVLFVAVTVTPIVLSTLQWATYPTNDH